MSNLVDNSFGMFRPADVSVVSDPDEAMIRASFRAVRSITENSKDRIFSSFT